MGREVRSHQEQRQIEPVQREDGSGDTKAEGPSGKGSYK